MLLCGCETWTFAKAVFTVLEDFHHRVARQMAGEMPDSGRHLGAPALGQ